MEKLVPCVWRPKDSRDSPYLRDAASSRPAGTSEGGIDKIIFPLY